MHTTDLRVCSIAGIVQKAIGERFLAGERQYWMWHQVKKCSHTFVSSIKDNLMTVTAEQIYAGQASFTKSTLAMYDQLVLGFTCGLIWRCSTARTLALYHQHLSAN